MQTFNGTNRTGLRSFRLLNFVISFLGAIPRIYLAAALFAAMAIPAYAGIRMADGQLISTGHSSAKLLHYLGKPISKSSSHGCLNRRCSKKGRIESWIYYYDNRTWTVRISGGVIIDTKWTRRNR